MALLASESDLASEITSVLLWAALSLIGAGKKKGHFRVKVKSWDGKLTLCKLKSSRMNYGWTTGNRRESENRCAKSFKGIATNAKRRRRLWIQSTALSCHLLHVSTPITTWMIFQYEAHSANNISWINLIGKNYTLISTKHFSKIQDFPPPFSFIRDELFFLLFELCSTNLRSASSTPPPQQYLDHLFNEPRLQNNRPRRTSVLFRVFPTDLLTLGTIVRPITYLFMPKSQTSSPTLCLGSLRQKGCPDFLTGLVSFSSAWTKMKKKS